MSNTQYTSVHAKSLVNVLLCMIRLPTKCTKVHRRSREKKIYQEEQDKILENELQANPKYIFKRIISEYFPSTRK